MASHLFGQRSDINDIWTMLQEICNPSRQFIIGGQKCCGNSLLRPIHGGDRLTVQLEPIRLDPCTFEVRSVFMLESQPVARGLIRHVAIAIEDRRRCALPEAIDRWLEASGLGQLRAL